MSISFLFSCTANVNGNCKVNFKVNNNVLVKSKNEAF